MAYSRSWQDRERLVAKWFGTKRNPLSGRNNVDDKGERRLGDIIYPYALIEVKRRKECSFNFAKEARELAKTRKLPWLVFEFKTAEPGLVKINMDYETAQKVCEFLAIEWEEIYGMERH